MKASRTIWLASILGLLTAQDLSSQSPNPDWSDKRKAQFYYDMAERALEGRDYSVALEAVSTCIGLDPALKEAYYVRGRVREGLQDLPGAITDYSICIDLDPQNSEAVFSRAQLRFRLRQFDLAREDFQRLLSMPPSETNSVFFQVGQSGGVESAFTTHGGNHKSRVFDYLGRTEASTSHFELAFVHFDSALRLDGRNPDIYLHRGQALLQMGDTVSANDELRKALKVDPGNSAARYQLALLQRAADPVQADQLLVESIESDSLLPYPYQERAFRRMQDGDYAGALGDYNMAVTLAPDDPENWFGRGTAREKLEDWRAAYDDYSEALRLKPDFNKALLNRGNVLFKLKLYREAISDYNEALVHYPNYGAGYYNRAVAHYSLKEYSMACQDLKLAEERGIKPDEKLKAKVCGSVQDR